MKGPYTSDQFAKFQTATTPPLFEGMSLPVDTPQRIRDQAELQELRHFAARQVAHQVAHHDRSIQLTAERAGVVLDPAQCPCRECSSVRRWVS